MNLPLKPRSRQGFYIQFSDASDQQPGNLEEIFQRLEESQRPRSMSESTAISRFESNETKHWTLIKSLGHGASGHVDLMRDANGNRYAVKKMRLTTRREDNRVVVRDLEFVMRSIQSAPNEHIVRFHGYARRSFEAWIVMEVMDSCFGKLLTRMSGNGMPEDVVGAVCACVVKALNHLKEKHKMIHRDVRPTNILVDRNGFIKLCDFGISRVLVNSLAHTVDAGNKYYLSPERVQSSRTNYGIKSDVWSLGVTLVELSRGVNPYADCDGDLVAADRICNQASPTLPESFSEEARDFVSRCLRKEENRRPNYQQLMQMSFFRKYENFDREVVGSWVRDVLGDDL